MCNVNTKYISLFSKYYQVGIVKWENNGKTLKKNSQGHGWGDKVSPRSPQVPGTQETWKRVPDPAGRVPVEHWF